MISTILLILYLIVGYVFAFYTWNAYDEDDSVEKDVVPKWIWWLIITVSSLIWPYWIVKLWIEKRSK